MKLIFIHFCFLFACCAASAAPAVIQKMQSMTLMTTEAPPFMSENMKEQGAGVYALRQVLKKLNRDLTVHFAPWPRAILTATRDKKVDGIFPSAATDLKDRFIYSRPIYEAAWVLIERRDQPMYWSKFDDLQGKTMGNVIGTELRDGIKDLVQHKKLNVENTTSDVFNLLKLANKRLDFVTMDAEIFRYLMMTEKELIPFRGTLRVNVKPITVVAYGLALKKNSENEKFVKLFDAANFMKSIPPHINFYFENFVEATAKPTAPSPNLQERIPIK